MRRFVKWSSGNRVRQHGVATAERQQHMAEPFNRR